MDVLLKSIQRLLNMWKMFRESYFIPHNISKCLLMEIPFFNHQLFLALVVDV